MGNSRGVLRQEKKSKMLSKKLVSSSLTRTVVDLACGFASVTGPKKSDCQRSTALRTAYCNRDSH